MMAAARGRRRWGALIVVALAAITLVTLVVLAAQWLRGLPEVQAWVERYPGSTDLPEGAPVGIPAWLAWQHFLNAFFLVLIVKSGWTIRSGRRPAAYWTRKNTVLRTKRPPTRISLDLWLHLSLDALWIANGVLYVVLLCVSGQWMRIVPTSWEIVPNALSAALQYASLNWPVEDGWVNYNSLQVLAYFVTVFIAAPLAFLSGLRMSPAWPPSSRLARIVPIQVARAVHFPVMLYFVLFVIVHVTLVLTTGALRNLSHMYAASATTTWVGIALFPGSVVLMVLAVIAARPLLLRPIAALTGKLSR